MASKKATGEQEAALEAIQEAHDEEGKGKLPSSKPGKAGEVEALGGFASFHAYYNPDNRCGQAAIGTMLDYWGKDPWRLPRTARGNDGNLHWDNAQLLDAVDRGGFGQDVPLDWFPLKFGTTGGRVLDACKRAGGLKGDIAYSGALSAGWDRIWSMLQQWVAANHPVPVLFDCGKLRGGPWGYHWGVVHLIDNQGVHVGNCPWQNPIPEAQFLEAWHCDKLPYGFNHCSVYVRP